MNNSNNNLQQAIQSTITTFLENRTSTNSDIAVDVYRTIRNEAHLLLERQLILDAFDADPFELMKVSTAEHDDDDSASSDKDLDENQDISDNKDEENNNDDILEKQKNTKVIQRIKNILHVISCTRTSTLDGYVRVHAVVELRNDGRMDKCVNENIRLHFTFLREPQHNDTVNESNADENAVESSREEERDSNAKQGSERNNNNTNTDIEQPAKKKRKGVTKQNNESFFDSKDETADDIIHTKQSNNSSSKGLTPKTIITYKIDYSIDYGKMEQLLGVDIYALGEHPSVETAVQMFDDDDDDDDVEDDMEEGTDQHLMKDNDEEARSNSCGGCCDTKGACAKVKQKQSTNNTTDFEDIEMSDDDDNSNYLDWNCRNQDYIEDNDNDNRGDRFGVYINPENVVSFLNRANINFNEQAVFYFLLTFPFYEHEWEIAGFILSALGEDEEEDDDGLEEGDEKDDCGLSNGCEIGCSGGKSCCN